MTGYHLLMMGFYLNGRSCLNETRHCGVNPSFSPLILEFKDHSEPIYVQKIEIVLIESPSTVFIIFLIRTPLFLFTS